MFPARTPAPPLRTPFARRRFGTLLTLGEEGIRPSRPLTTLSPPAPPTGRLEPGSRPRKCRQRFERPAQPTSGRRQSPHRPQPESERRAACRETLVCSARYARAPRPLPPLRLPASAPMGFVRRLLGGCPRRPRLTQRASPLSPGDRFEGGGSSAAGPRRRVPPSPSSWSHLSLGSILLILLNELQKPSRSSGRTRKGARPRVREVMTQQ